jgi:PST family polysaccharide transporter
MERPPIKLMVHKISIMPADMKRLFENSLSLFALQAANYILPFITIPYLIRILGTEKFGLTVFASAMMQYLAVFTDYGFNFTATEYCY